MTPDLRYPNNDIDPHITGREVYILDTNSLQANVIKQVPGRLISIHGLDNAFEELQEHPEQMEECADKGIDQLLAIQEFTSQNTCITAPGQKAGITSAANRQQWLLQTELTPAEKRFGAAQYEALRTGQGFETIEPKRYDLFFETAIKARKSLDDTKRAPWDGRGNTHRPSRVDLSIAATIAALAYDQGKTVVCLSQDKAIGAILREIPHVLGFKPDAHYIAARSIFKEINGEAIVRVGKAYDRMTH